VPSKHWNLITHSNSTISQKNGIPIFSVVFMMEMFNYDNYCIFIAGKEVTPAFTAEKFDEVCAKLKYSPPKSMTPNTTDWVSKSPVYSSYRKELQIHDCKLPTGITPECISHHLLQSAYILFIMCLARGLLIQLAVLPSVQHDQQKKGALQMCHPHNSTSLRLMRWSM
jgi:hypothetical protein